MNKLKMLLDEEITLIYDNYDEFVEKLCKFEDVMDLYQVSFSSDNMYFTYVIDSGMHISDYIDIVAYEALKRDILNGC